MKNLRSWKKGSAKVGPIHELWINIFYYFFPRIFYFTFANGMDHRGVCGKIMSQQFLIFKGTIKI